LFVWICVGWWVETNNQTFYCKIHKSKIIMPISELAECNKIKPSY
jgi:hypothetical protein